MTAKRIVRDRLGELLLTATAITAVVMSAMPTGVEAAGASASYRHGLKLMHPGQTPLATSPHALVTSPNTLVTSPNTLVLQSSANPGAVDPHPRVYLVFWGSQWSKDPAGVRADLPRLFSGLFGASDTWGTILNQYCEGLAAGTVNCGSAGVHVQHPGSSPLGGIWDDTSAPTPAKATPAQIGDEAVKAAAHFGNTTQASNLNSIYVVASPTGADPDTYIETGFCGWHDYASAPGGNGVSPATSQYGNLAFVNLPYIPDRGPGACTTLTGRLLDGIESTVTHEYAEAVTDFWPGLVDPTGLSGAGWNDSNGQEIGDYCATLDARVTLTTGTFDLQGLWSNDKSSCVTSESGATAPPSVGPPGAATNVSAVANGGGGATVSWTPPASDGGAPISYYAVYAYSANGTTNTVVTGNPTSYVEKALTANQYYTFTVLPWNGSFWGAWSAWAPWTLVT